jgi:hypothetical protein
MAAKQFIAVTSGAFTDIPATIFSNYVKIVEDGAAGGGLKVKFPSDNFTQVYTFAAGVPIELGTPNNTGEPGRAPMLGKPARTIPVPNAAGNYTNISEPATIYCKIESVGATSNVRVDERP